jgi:hypothetical protein
MFSFRARREKPVLIADIEGGSAAVAIVLIREGHPARIIVSERKYLPLEGIVSENLTKATLRLLSDLVWNSVKKYAESEMGKRHGAVESLFAIVGTPWVRSRTSIAEESFDRERSVTKTMIHGLAKRALETPSSLDVARVFESSVTRVQLNGYPTGRPEGKSAHHISVTAFQSDIETEVKQGIEATLHQFFPGRAVDFRSAARSALFSLHEKAPSHHYVLVNVGSTASECIAVHKEDTSDHVSAPIGVATIAQKLSGEHGFAEEVFTLLRMLATDACTAPACAALKVNLSKLEPELVKIFGDMFSTIAKHRKVPNTCFLSVHADMAPWFEHFLSRIDFAQFTVTAQPLSVVLLTPDHLQDAVTWSGVHEDTGLGLATAFVNTLDD